MGQHGNPDVEPVRSAMCHTSIMATATGRNLRLAAEKDGPVLDRVSNVEALLSGQPERFTRTCTSCGVLTSWSAPLAAVAVMR